MSRGGPFAHLRRVYAQARDDYVLVFFLILFVIILTSIAGGPGLKGVLVAAVQTVALLMTLRSAGVQGRRLTVARVLAAIPVIASLTAVVLQRNVGPAYYVSMIILIISTQAAIIVNAVRRSRTITLDTVMAALCVYLLVGLLFAYADSFYGAYGTPFFVQSGPHEPVDYVYFSFVTLTTVGYGDLTPGPAVARIFAFSEALLGQIYLVTVIALLVGNLGAQRIPRHPEEGGGP